MKPPARPLNHNGTLEWRGDHLVLSILGGHLKVASLSKCNAFADKGKGWYIHTTIYTGGTSFCGDYKKKRDAKSKCLKMMRSYLRGERHWPHSVDAEEMPRSGRVVSAVMKSKRNQKLMKKVNT